MIDVLVFGAGESYINRINYFNRLSSTIKIVAVVDNNKSKWGSIIAGVEVCSPEAIFEFKYDVILVISDRYYDEISEQLIGLNIPKTKIWNNDCLKAYLIGEKYKETEVLKNSEKTVLIITNNMGESGGALSSIYAAIALKEKDYYVDIAAPFISDNSIDRLKRESIGFIEWYSLPNISQKDYRLLDKYTIIIVNVLPMINVAYLLSDKYKINLWIHEGEEEIYTECIRKYPDILKTDWLDKIHVICVSNIAKKLFKKYFYNDKAIIMPFGIPDERLDNNNESKFVFGVFGRLCDIKGQKILINAINSLPEEYKEKIKLVIVGGNRGYLYNDSEDIVSKLSCIEYVGKKSHDEVIKIMHDVDVVVCPSIIETMSMSVVEGMMLGKPCIVSSNTGIASYVKDGINGFIFENKNINDLKDKISLMMSNIDRIEEMGENARQTYEKYFSMEVLSNNLEKNLVRMEKG